MHLHCTVIRQLPSLQLISNHINLPKQSSTMCLHTVWHLPWLAVLTRFILAEGGREVLCACCITTLSKAQLWQSYCGAASTWAIFPASLLQSRQVWTRARMHLTLWPAPLTVLGLFWRLSTPVPQSNGWELGKRTQRQCWTNLLGLRILGTHLRTASNRAATSMEDWEDRGCTVGEIR